MSEMILGVDGVQGDGDGPLLDERPMKRILFVDDERHVLESLRDVMRGHRHQWRVDFASSGAEALAALDAEPADVVIADMQMPAVDGAALLAQVRDSHPTTIRMILSGNASPPELARAAMVSHRFVAKPCDADELGRLITDSCALRALTAQAAPYRVTAGVTVLPSRPGLHSELNRIVAGPRWEFNHVAAVIERDVAMTAKVLQLANSGFFGVGRSVTSVQDAVMYLGVETIESLALTAEAFGQLGPSNIEGFSTTAFQNHAILVARITAAILPAGRAQQEAVTAALLHDIGELVMITDAPAQWLVLNDEARRRGLPLHAVESERDGITHGDTGAYLLSLWGLPDVIVEAVAHHHDPGAGMMFDAAVAVHVADALAHELEPAADGSASSHELDEALIERLGLTPRLELWRHLASQLTA